VVNHLRKVALQMLSVSEKFNQPKIPIRLNPHRKMLVLVAGWGSPARPRRHTKMWRRFFFEEVRFGGFFSQNGVWIKFRAMYCHYESIEICVVVV
jgi:hypothetical protein